jgi:hypothetical protein
MMTGNGRTGLTSDRCLRQEIVALKQLEKECFASRKRFAIDDYLAGVFDLYRRLKNNLDAKQCARRIVEFEGLRRKSSHPLRVIIDAASQADNKTKSRSTRALRYCWRQRKRWTDFKTFLRENGGPAGCASKFADVNPKPPGACVRVGGEGRVPKIPLFVDRTMIDRHGCISWELSSAALGKELVQ